MKVAIFTDIFLPGIGGTENAVLRYATKLSENNEVLVCAPDYHRENIDATLPFKVLRAKSICFSKNDCWAMPAITPEIKVELEAFKPDVIHCHTLGKMAAYANHYAKKNNIPVINTVHTKYRYCYRNALKSDALAELFLRIVIKRVKDADRVCSVSDSMVKELETYGVKNSVSVIRNGNELKVVCEEKPKQSVFTMLYVGLIIDYKNIGFSIEALKQVKKLRPDFKFYIVGRGPHENKFKSLVKKYDLTKNVEFTGAIADKQELAKYYSKADLFLFPSLFDSAGLVLCEAAGYKTPSLLLKESSAAEIFTDNQTAFLVDNNVKAYAEKILELMDQPELIERVGQNAHTVFDGWENTVKSYMEIYSELIEQRKA